MKKSKKLPKYVYIRGFKWTIKALLKAVDDDGIDVDGSACDVNKILEVKSTLGLDLKLETFLHEYFHGVWYETGINEELPKELAWLEHMFNVALSKDMTNNKKLFKKLFKDFS